MSASFSTYRSVTKTRKAWACEWCGGYNLPGQPCTVHTGLFYDYFWTGRYHPECYEALRDYWGQSGESPEPGSMLRGLNVERGEACEDCEAAEWSTWSTNEMRKLCATCANKEQQLAIGTP